MVPGMGRVVSGHALLPILVPIGIGLVPMKHLLLVVGCMSLLVVVSRDGLRAVRWGIVDSVLGMVVPGCGYLVTRGRLMALVLIMVILVTGN